ncbi:MAG: sensor histidine kinase [Acidobacteria bacterium]|nr:MAG: sensor histidine kinase [Acidobacteriota bacterium]
MNEHRDHCAKLLSLAVHEFRSPVAVVSGYLRLLVKHFADNLTEKQLHLLQESEKSCGALSKLLADLAELAQLEADSVGMRREPVPIFALLREVASNVHEGSDRGVTLEVVAPETDVVVEGDRGRLSAALASVLHAVLRERPGATRLMACGSVQCESAPRVVIAVADGETASSLSGAGDHVLGAGFDEYRGGLGFRLPIAARVIEAHGGRLHSPVTERGQFAIVVALPLTSPDAEKTG